MIPVPAHIILRSRRGGENKNQRETYQEIEHGEHREQREENGGRRAEGVNVHIINLDYLGDRVATSPGALETAGQAFAGS